MSTGDYAAKLGLVRLPLNEDSEVFLDPKSVIAVSECPGGSARTYVYTGAEMYFAVNCSAAETLRRLAVGADR